MFNFGIVSVRLSANRAFYWVDLVGDIRGSIRPDGPLAGKLGWFATEDGSGRSYLR